MSVRRRYIKTALKVLLGALMLAGVAVVASVLTDLVVVASNVHDETVVQTLGFVFGLICGYPAFTAFFWLWDRD